MKTDTLFDLASNSKMYATNMMLMKLVDLKLLDLTQTIKHYIPGYSGNLGYNEKTGVDEAMTSKEGVSLSRDKIKVMDILTHQAGYSPEVLFFSNRSVDDGYSPFTPSSLQSNDPVKTKKLIIKHVPLHRVPGNKHVYSDTDFMLLGILVERIINDKAKSIKDGLNQN